MSPRKPGSDGFRRYGCWGGNPEGTKEDLTRCVESVIGNERGSIPRQCSRKRGHGPDGLYCKIHDPAFIAEKDKKEQRKWDLERELSYVTKYKCETFFRALKQIADGHNDARGLAKETIGLLRDPDEIRKELKELK